MSDINKKEKRKLKNIVTFTEGDIEIVCGPDGPEEWERFICGIKTAETDKGVKTFYVFRDIVRNAPTADVWIEDENGNLLKMQDDPESLPQCQDKSYIREVSDVVNNNCFRVLAFLDDTANYGVRGRCFVPDTFERETPVYYDDFAEGCSFDGNFIQIYKGGERTYITVTDRSKYFPAVIGKKEYEEMFGAKPEPELIAEFYMDENSEAKNRYEKDVKSIDRMMRIFKRRFTKRNKRALRSLVKEDKKPGCLTKKGFIETDEEHGDKGI